MKLLAALLVASMVFTSTASAQAGLEIDFDGTVGNGPDITEHVLGDYISADVWIVGQSNPIIVAGLTICDLDGIFDFLGYADGTGWGTVTPPILLSPGCYQVSASDFTGTLAMTPPFVHGTATYYPVNEGAIGDLGFDISPLVSSYLTIGFGQFPFEYSLGGSVWIVGGSTEDASWGDVKSLFR